MTVEWRHLPSDPRYLVSSDGRIKSPDGRARGRILKGTPKENGYLLVAIKKQGGGFKTKYVHHLVAEAFHGPRPNGMHVAHLDGTRTNNCADNLLYCSIVENFSHKKSHGTQALGETVNGAKLTDMAVRVIRRCSSVPTSFLCKIFAVSYAPMYYARKGTTWRHIPMPSP